MKNSVLTYFTALLILLVASCQSAEEKMLDKIRSDGKAWDGPLWAARWPEQDSSTAENKTQETIKVESGNSNLYITKSGGYPACISRGDLNKMVGYANQKDIEAMEMLFKSQRCITIKGGAEVYLESVGSLATVVEIRPKGQEGTIWTVREAIIKK